MEEIFTLDLYDRVKYKKRSNHPLKKWKGIIDLTDIPSLAPEDNPSNFITHEKEYVAITKIPKNDLIVFDIGANIGQSVHSFMSLRKDLTIYSYEPNPLAFDVLKAKCKFLSNVTLFNYGLGLNNLQCQLWIPVIEGLIISPLGTIHKERLLETEMLNYLNKMSQGSVIELIKIEINIKNSFSNEKRPDIVKVDVEGEEVNILKLLFNDKLMRPLLIIEKSKPYELSQLLKLNDYETFILNEKKDFIKMVINKDTPKDLIPLNIVAAPRGFGIFEF